MGADEKVVARFTDGKVMKGYIDAFRIDAESFLLRNETSPGGERVAIADLKALFFVKTFDGEPSYKERKSFSFGARKPAGRKIFIKFLDNETLVGHVDGAIPWDKGFSLEKLGENAQGFFIIPVDADCNNDRVFVVGRAIKDVTIMPV